MTSPLIHEASRRLAVKSLLGGSLALPILHSPFGLMSSAAAQGYAGVQPGKDDLVHIPGASVQSIAMAEWDIPNDDSQRGARTLIAQGKEALEHAPATASRYEAKNYEFPSGTLRILTWKRGGPIIHQLTFSTEIFVLKGSATLSPLYGVPGNPVTVSAGDALYFPAGVLRNMKPTEDFVVIAALVATATENPKSGIIREKDATPRQTAQWEQDGKPMSATTPEEFAKAPAGAVKYTSKRYNFDGNSMRVSTFAKGGKSSVVVTSRSDVLMYCIKGRFRRTEGNEVFEFAAGDAMREKLGNPGFWEPLEESAYFATDAPVLPAAFASTMVGR